jgi:hypothetical protein
VVLQLLDAGCERSHTHTNPHTSSGVQCGNSDLAWALERTGERVHKSRTALAHSTSCIEHKQGIQYITEV